MTPTTIFVAVAGIIKSIPIVDKWFSQLVASWMDRQNIATLSGISDAAAFAARAQTQEDRFQASEKWRLALSRDRVTS